jgi:hypothetical protein
MDTVPVTALRGEPVGLPPTASNPDSIGAVRRWLTRHTGEELNVVSQEPTELAIETLPRSGLAAIFVIRRYATMPKAGIAYRSMSPAPLVEVVIAYRRDDPSPTLANLLQVVDELAIDGSGLPEDGELI